MATVRSRAWVRAPVEEVFAFFDDPRNLARLMPPPVRIELVRIEPDPPQPGSIFEFAYGLGPFRKRWLVRLVDREVPHRFVDETISGPMARFHHEHHFAPGRTGTWIADEIEYHVGPEGRIGVVVDWLAGWVMRATFVWRAARQRQLLRGG
jgi:ligand-binding SRPBCC domain-containing protein